MVKVEVKFAVEEAMKSQRGIKGIALLFLNLGTRWDWTANATPRPLYPRECIQSVPNPLSEARRDMIHALLKSNLFCRTICCYSTG